MVSISTSKTQWIKEKIRDVPDFPKPGIIFKDVTTLIKDPEAFTYVVDALSEEAKKLKPTKIAGIEARGFIFGAAVAYKLGLGFVPIRKPGKLPYQKESLSYDLEYGKDCVEIHVDAVVQDEKVVLIDDLLATGGTASAACKLLQKIGADVVGAGFVVDLEFLGGKLVLPEGVHFFSIVAY
jgi:adenine phosphoribosyltransferase